MDRETGLRRRAHRLVWSALVKRKIEEAGTTGSANDNTYALGRDGHFELNLVTSADKVEGFKADAKKLLAALAYDTGHRYEDFNASTDRVAQYGLAALIGGVAAKKLGLLAVMAAFAAKFAKIIAVGAIALVAGLKSFFSRRGSGPGPRPAPRGAQAALKERPTAPRHSPRRPAASRPDRSTGLRRAHFVAAVNIGPEFDLRPSLARPRP